MSQFFQIHPENPQARLIKQAADIVRKGGVIAYPTDSAYALGCHLGDKAALERIRSIRRLDDKHNFTLMCRDLSELGNYARVDNSAFRLLKNLIPGPYTFILRATPEVPKRLHHPKRKSVGLRVPDNQICLDLLAELGEPLMSVSLILPGDELPMTDPYDIRDTLGSQLDLVIDGGYCGMEATSVVDLVDDVPVIVRRGLGDVSQFEEAL
ncbi:MULTISPECIES: L-threonylcarbamoyladenylate synthase [Spongiibacter]|jgi:tRNA threonylcarbamoyl adenosine modification protein (Sua5/YciO/YrdC/YwlC family)|uniref:L-threonylcarbamoyladenylate synthase n=1 Tax=Spongiibacter TaxID=630749 RepID=UPI0003B731A4|nr:MULTISPECIES: L-threonylcarbamoyladenylate synthase [Spongiibacter]MBO6752136.1 threonylcarbamoyl-AMP synthase [Spongiibacter sp.]MBU70749.1 threonylcarbamoyl-AMP synthase [Spongiibacter sp.]|tara:strand:- start:34645 stop:35274 length:630 start_codon:yes stop_codon:yes gene_type:complete